MIPLEKAMHLLEWYTNQMEIGNFILEGLKIVMFQNFFKFNDTYWLQRRGIAMGQPVSPIIATLYVAMFERQWLPMFSQSIKLYKRYLDDVIICWNGSIDNLNGFINELETSDHGLQFKIERHDSKEFPFLDFQLTKNGIDFYQTKSYSKPLNLFLYIPATSAHPPGILRSLIHGFIYRFKFQNSSKEDFENEIKCLYKKLRLRGYNAAELKTIIGEAIATNHKKGPVGRKIPLHLPYDPNGPSPHEIRLKLGLNNLQKCLDEKGLGRLVISFSRPKNLQEYLIKNS